MKELFYFKLESKNSPEIIWYPKWKYYFSIGDRIFALRYRLAMYILGPDLRDYMGVSCHKCGELNYFLRGRGTKFKVVEYKNEKS